MAQLFLTKVEVRFTLGQVDGKLQRIEHLGLVTALDRRLAEAAGAVAGRVTRQDGKLHDGLSSESPRAARCVDLFVASFFLVVFFRMDGGLPP